MVERRIILAFASAALALIGSSTEAFAAGRQGPLTDVIHVRPGATCVEAATLAEHVAAWLGADTADADVWVRVQGSQDDPRDVSFELGRRDRVLARRRFAPGPARCDHLQAAIGLAIALALRVSLLEELVGPSGEAAFEARSPWSVGGGPIVALGVLPGASLGAGLRIERAFPPNFALRVGAMGLGAWDRTFSTVGGSYDAETWAVEVDACVRLDLATGLAAHACVGLLAGELLAQGRDFASSRTASSGWSAVANAVDLDVALADRWALLAGAALVLPLGSTQVGVLSARGDVVEARDLSAIGVTMTLGPLYRF
ncbi:MAG TPA: hypothetical protein VKU41_32545 [Polyangiaceae bacterium]|nr:hypothetical protein [Polyangiaceae bacterium]